MCGLLDVQVAFVVLIVQIDRCLRKYFPLHAKMFLPYGVEWVWQGLGSFLSAQTKRSFYFCLPATPGNSKGDQV
jgi:hypothetical protein